MRLRLKKPLLRRYPLVFAEKTMLKRIAACILIAALMATAFLGCSKTPDDAVTVDLGEELYTFENPESFASVPDNN